MDRKRLYGVDGTQVDAEDVFGINREDASTSIIHYQSAEVGGSSSVGITMPGRTQRIYNF